MAVEHGPHGNDALVPKVLIHYGLLIALSVALFVWSRGSWPWPEMQPASPLIVFAYGATGLIWAVALNGDSRLRPLATGAAMMALAGLLVASRVGLAPTWLVMAVTAAVLLVVVWNGAHLAVRVRRGHGTLGQRLRVTLSGIIPPSVRALAAKEFDVWIAVFFPSLLRNRHVAGQSFHMGRTGSDVMTLIILIGIGIVEAAVVHLILYAIVPTFAVILLGVSLLALVYLFGVARSLRAVPTTLEADRLTIRLGVLRSQVIELTQISEVQVIGGVITTAAELMTISIIDPPNVRLLLKRPLAGRSLFGKPRAYRAIDFRLDEPEGFARLLTAALEADCLQPSVICATAAEIKGGTG